MDINHSLIRGTCISTVTDEYGPIYVYQTRTSRILSFDGKIYQSSMKLNNVKGLTLDYTQAMMTGLMFVPNIHTATVMGLGAGSMVKSLLSSFSELNVHAVEYREAVVKTAKDYFFLPDTKRLEIHIDDAMNFIKNTTIKSDIIFSDLYNSEGMEPQQVQSSYLADCTNALNDQGVLVLNIWHTALTSELASTEELNNLLSREFENRLLSFKVKSGNTIVLAFKNDIPTMNRNELITKAQWLGEKMNLSMEDYVSHLI